MSGYLIPDLIYYDTGREREGNVRIINGIKKRHIQCANIRMVQGFVSRWLLHVCVLFG